MIMRGLPANSSQLYMVVGNLGVQAAGGGSTAPEGMMPASA